MKLEKNVYLPTRTGEQKKAIVFQKTKDNIVYSPPCRPLTDKTFSFRVFYHTIQFAHSRNCNRDCP